MIQSMTGFGRSVLYLSDKKVTVEVRSLNSKNFDLTVRMPSYYKEKELSVRKELARKLIRGKVDFSIYIEMTADRTSSTVNEAIVTEYMQQLRKIVQIDSKSDLEFLRMALAMPDALKTEREELDEAEWSQINETIQEVTSEIIQYRMDEAVSLESDFRLRIGSIQSYLEQVKSFASMRIAHVKDRLQKAIDGLKIETDQNRFEQELIYYLEKLDIHEEEVRLSNHLTYFLKEMETDHSNGKKLGFIVQEIGREINTIGSKANFVPIQQAVIQMKDELEKIKEQLLNIL